MISQMAAVVPENLRILLSHYTFETDTDSKIEDLTCVMCSKLMIDAYQTGCGCQYCRECVVGYLSDGNKYCRGGKEDCQEDRLVLDDNVTKSAALNRKILRVRVHCPNRPCVFISPLAVMDDHLRVCGQQPLECPYTTIGCGSEGASKDKMETHLRNETLTHSRLLMEAINNLRNELGRVCEGNRMSQLEVMSVREELRMNETARRGVLEQLEEERRLRREEKEELLEQMKKQRKEQLDQINELKIKLEYSEKKSREGLSRMTVLEGAVATMGREIDRGSEERRTVEIKAQQNRSIINVPHKFKAHTFMRPVFCDHCDSLLLGLMNQGLQCQVCKLNIHKRCEKNVAPLCGVNSKDLVETIKTCPLNPSDFGSPPPRYERSFPSRNVPDAVDQRTGDLVLHTRSSSSPSSIHPGGCSGIVEPIEWGLEVGGCRDGKTGLYNSVIGGGDRCGKKIVTDRRPSI